MPGTGLNMGEPTGDTDDLDGDADGVRHQSSLRRRRAPLQVGDSLDRLRRTWGWPSATSLDEAIGVVRSVLGPLAEGAIIQSDRHGDLVVSVSEPAIAEAIRVRTGVIMNGIREACGASGPEAIRVVIARPR